MSAGKGAYLRRLTSSTRIRSRVVGKELDGSSPPSLFIGSWNYPDVLAGPLIAPQHGNCGIMDTPEAWIPAGTTQEDILGYRLNLVRGKRHVGVSDLDNRFVETIQEIALAGSSIDSHAGFKEVPNGTAFSDEYTPFGPSAMLERFEIGNVSWDPALEKVYNDTDLQAADGIMDLHRKGVAFSSIQKAFSAGTMGLGLRRRLVPTRWSITACDTTIGDRLLAEVRQYDPIDTCRVHEFSSLHNHYAVLLIPTCWQYEWMEAFLHVLGREELIFADHEGFRPKAAYSSVGGCFYSCRMAVLEALAREKKQAGAIIFREAYKGYIPMGVFNVRENVRNAMLRPAAEFDDMNSALYHISRGLMLPIERFREESRLFREITSCRQTTLKGFGLGG